MIDIDLFRKKMLRGTLIMAHEKVYTIVDADPDGKWCTVQCDSMFQTFDGNPDAIGLDICFTMNSLIWRAKIHYSEMTIYTQS